MKKKTDPSKYFKRYGGLLDRSSLDKDSSLGISWSIGESVVELALKRLEGIEGALPLDFNIGVVNEPLLNAVASRKRGSYLVAIFWPLPLTIQGVAAAIWADPCVAPWIGDVSRLKRGLSLTLRFPWGLTYSSHNRERSISTLQCSAAGYESTM
jgi:hypothetical protein